MSAPVRIAYTCHDGFPSPDINTQQIFRTTLEVARRGVQVEVIVPAVTVGAGASDPRPAIAAHYGASGAVPDAWTIRAVGPWASRHTRDRARFDFTVSRHIVKRDIDIVWTRDALAALTCARAGLPTLFETYRPDYATRRRFAPWRRALRATGQLRGLITHTRFAARAFVAAGVVEERCLVAYNGVAPELMAPVLPVRDARSRLGLDGDRPLVVYAGRVLRGATTDLLIALARGVPEATLMVLGLEPESDVGRWLAGCARRSGADNLVIHGRVPPAAVAPFLYAADCLVVQPYDDPARRHRRHMLPIKVFSYLAARRPILAPRLPDLEEVLTDGVTACLFDARAPEDAVSALRRILVDAELRERLGRNASQLAPTHTWSARAAVLIPFLHDCAAHGGPVAGPGRSVGYADRSASAAATSSRE